MIRRQAPVYRLPVGRAVEVQDLPLGVVGCLVGYHEIVIVVCLLEAEIPNFVAIFQINMKAGIERRVNRASLR